MGFCTAINQMAYFVGYQLKGNSQKPINLDTKHDMACSMETDILQGRHL